MEPARTALCLECRTALAPGEACDAHPRAKPVNLADTSDRERAVDAVWGPPHLRARQAAKAGAAGGGTGAGLEACEGCDAGGLDFSGEVLGALLVILLLAIAAVVLFIVGKKVVHWVREHRNRPRPAGSSWQPPRSDRKLRGTIRNARLVTAPSGERCAAWTLVVTNPRATGGRVVLRDGVSGSFELALDDGRTVSVPGGRARVVGDAESRRLDRAYVQTIDPAFTPTDPTPVLAGDDGHETRLADGDRVEVTSGLVERFDASVSTGYREAPPTILAIDGVPTILRLSA